MKAASRIILLPVVLAIACLGFVHPAGAVEAAEAPSADIAISSMTDAPDPVDVGEELTYTITVTNMGPDGMDAIAVSDTLPDGVDFVSASTSNEGACSEDNRLVECGLGRLEVDDAVTVTIVVRPTESGNIENSATVDILSGVASLDPDLSNNTATVTTEVIDPVPTADLAITSMTDAPDPVTVGEELTYTIQAINNGPDGVDSVVVSDTLPSGVEFVSVESTPVGECMNDNGFLECDLGRLEPDEGATITIKVIPTRSGTLENSATIDTLSSLVIIDPDLGNNTATASTTVESLGLEADLAITSLTGMPDPVNVGSELIYSIDVSNNGPDRSDDVVVTDTLPAGVGFLSVEVSPAGECDHSEGVVSCSLGALEADEVATITIKVQPLASGTITNSAEVEMSGGVEPASTGFGGVVDPDPSNNMAMIETQVLPTPSGEITILGPVALNRQTGLLEQGVRFTNLADGTLPSVRINIEDLPEDVAIFNHSGQDENGVYVEAFGDVAMNASVDFLVEFLRGNRMPFDDPTYSIGILNEIPPAHLPPSGTVLEITRRVLTDDGSLLIEFTSVPGYVYTIQYKTDLENEAEEWKNAVPVIEAVANRTQWLDDGPPKTESRISEASQRFYRVIERLR